jgi:hypothetical protein
LSFLVDESGEVVVDYVGRFENLQNDFDVVCDKIGMDTPSLPRALETQHEHYTEYYDSETREHVGLRYKEDIEYFGYEF